jgi:hypothetical protein
MIALLMFLQATNCRLALGDTSELTEAQIARDPRIGIIICEALDIYNAKSSGTSTLVRRFSLLFEGPKHGIEITDKG